MAIMGQRLIRMLCPECKEPYEPSDVELRSAGLDRSRLEGGQLYQPGSCGACGGAGFRGRRGVYELLEMSPDIRELAFNKKPTAEVRAKARSEGMATLFEDGIRKVLGGLTTIPEVLRLATRDDA